MTALSRISARLSVESLTITATACLRNPIRRTYWQGLTAEDKMASSGRTMSEDLLAKTSAEDKMALNISIQQQQLLMTDMYADLIETSEAKEINQVSSFCTAMRQLEAIELTDPCSSRRSSRSFEDSFRSRRKLWRLLNRQRQLFRRRTRCSRQTSAPCTTLRRRRFSAKT